MPILKYEGPGEVRIDGVGVFVKGTRFLVSEEIARSFDGEKDWTVTRIPAPLPEGDGMGKEHVTEPAPQPQAEEEKIDDAEKI